VNKHDEEYYKRQAQIVVFIDALYYDAINEILKGAHLSTLPTDKVFLFKHYPKLSEYADDVINKCSNSLTVRIKDTQKWAWNEANLKNDEIAKAAYERRNLAPPKSMLNHNSPQLSALQSRKINGLTLSERVWDYNNANLKDDIQKLIDYAIREGKSARQLSLEVRQYLKNPDALFRRIRDKNGNLKWSAEALNYHPGRGVYRSAYKNAMRLAREEINRAYREAEWIRWQQNPSVIGYRVVTSNRVATVCEICKELAGVYPKSFKFLGWHVQCMCHCEAILCPDEDFEKILRDRNYAPQQPAMPENYIEYEREHQRA
jgi:hypothetical protein